MTDQPTVVDATFGAGGTGGRQKAAVRQSVFKRLADATTRLVEVLQPGQDLQRQQLEIQRDQVDVTRQTNKLLSELIAKLDTETKP